MSKGWHGEPYRHSLASRGIKTTGKGKVDSSISKNHIKNPRFSLFLENGELQDRHKYKIQELNERAQHKYEWIADLDVDENGDVFIADEQVSDKEDESELNWQDDVTNENRYPDMLPDEENCVGYIHYHPSTVDERATAADFELALTLHHHREDDSKEKLPYTTFCVVTDEYAKFFFLNPSDEEEAEELHDSFKEIEQDAQDLDTKQYFSKVKKLKDKMKSEGVLETKMVEYSTVEEEE